MKGSRSFVLALLTLAAGASIAQPKKRIRTRISRCRAEKRVALNEWRREVSVDRAKWPKGDVPGLDFTKEKGNAIIVHPESGRHSDPIMGTLSNAPPFKLFHLEDDPYRVTSMARGAGLDKPEDKAKYRTDKYKPALEHMARAKYVLFVVAKVQEPKVDAVVKRFTPGSLEGAGVLYEIESRKLLGGYPLEARNSDKVSSRTGGYTGQELDTLMHDFENNARAALSKGMKARFPSAKLPTIVYLDSKE